MAMPSTRPSSLPATPIQKQPDPDYGTSLIPKERYTSREYAEHEWERMWTRTWLMAGRESDIQLPGDYVTFEIGSESIVLIRQGEAVSPHATTSACIAATAWWSPAEAMPSSSSVSSTPGCTTPTAACGKPRTRTAFPRASRRNDSPCSPCAATPGEASSS